MSKQAAEPTKDMKQTSPIRGILIPLGIGGLAQFAFARGSLLLGLIGYGIAIWFFVTRLRCYLETDSPDEDQVFDLKLFREEIRLKSKTLAFIRKNWREMTIAEIFSGSFKLPDDKEVKP